MLSLNKDGSGTVTEETTMGAAVLEQMAAFGGGEGGFADQFGDKEAAEKRAAEMGEGVTVVSAEAIDENGRKGDRVVFAFEDINKLQYRFGGGMDDMGEGMGGEQPEEKEEPIPFHYEDGVLTMVNPQDKDAAAGEKPEAEEIDDQSLEMARQMMGDMKMSLKLTFPGGIAETNASHHEGDTVTLMEMEMGKLLEDPAKFRQLAQAQPESPREMQQALEGIEGVKVESQDELKVTLK